MKTPMKLHTPMFREYAKTKMQTKFPQVFKNYHTKEFNQTKGKGQ